MLYKYILIGKYKLILIIILIFNTSCSEIFRTELPPIIDCTDDNELCSYKETIQSILDIHCVRCHGSQGRFDADLDLSTYPRLMLGGQNGPVIIEGDSESSILWQRIVNINSPMPPAYDSPMLDNNYISMIAKWIDNGAINN